MNDLGEQFRNPGPAYRGKPFWSWNGELDRTELLRQIRVMKEMGLGGFFMHSRTGLRTEYLGESWFELIDACADEGEREGMEAWLYDEDRWPSGTAGGLVTREPAFRARSLTMETSAAADFAWTPDTIAAFACRLEGLACHDARRLQRDGAASLAPDHTVLRFRDHEVAPSTFYNGYTDVDRLSREATDRFLALTHEAYRAHCGERFGRTLRGIFTDEPHRGAVMTGFGQGAAGCTASVPWTAGLPAAFAARFGYDLLERLPELFLQPDGRAVSPVKWHFMELLQQRFLDNFVRPMYAWCEANHLQLTGHFLHEDSLAAQSAMMGSMMRGYEWMHAPGIDILSEGNRNYWVAKQLSSAGRQIGRPWLLSELYGCTGWQMGFAGHKAVGDWQALLGVNLRCHHLSWYTMAGEAKRDYPASLFHQSAWWPDYPAVEDYFARLGLMLSHGEPCCDVLVIHPVESVWAQIHAGWADGLAAGADEARSLEARFEQLFFWLMGSQIDFDYGDEEMLGRLAGVDADGAEPLLRVGKAAYRAVVLGGMTTVRATTLELLAAFRAAGGAVLFLGDPPAYVDALPSSAAMQAAETACRLPWDGEALRQALTPRLSVPIQAVDTATGSLLPGIFCQTRHEGGRLVFAALNTDREAGIARAALRLRVPKLAVEEWDCRTGERFAVPATYHGGWLEIPTRFAAGGERVFVLGPTAPESLPTRPERRMVEQNEHAGPFEYRLEEPNVCVLDMVRWRVDGGAWSERMEILKADRAIRRHFDLPLRGGEMIQPWYQRKFLPAPLPLGRVDLQFELDCEEALPANTTLCLESPAEFRASWDGLPLRLDADPESFWVDIAFRKVPLRDRAMRKAGHKSLILTVDFHAGIDLEALYLTGDFGVKLRGGRPVIVALPERLRVGDLTAQGFPFYGAGIAYRIDAPPAGDSERLELRVPSFEGACLRLQPWSDAAEPKQVVGWAPYEADITKLAAEGPVALTVVLTRRNTFGPLHQVPLQTPAYGPGNFVTEGAAWSDDYMLCPAGLLAPPVVRRVV